MLTVATFVSASKIDGLGVFATSPVPAGAVVWRFNPLIDVVIRPAQLFGLPDHVINYLNKYSYLDTDGNIHIGLDNDKFINHSYCPNVGPGLDGTRIALIDIDERAEITEDYTVTCPNDNFALSGEFPGGLPAR
jgi:hypothetical protein